MPSLAKMKTKLLLMPIGRKDLKVPKSAAISVVYLSFFKEQDPTGNLILVKNIWLFFTFFFLFIQFF